MHAGNGRSLPLRFPRYQRKVGRLTNSGPLAQLRLICIVMGFAFLAISMVEPLVPLYGLFLGASPALVGIIVSAAYLFPSLLAVPLGSMTDRWGPRQVTILGAALFLAGPLIVVLLPGLPILVVAQILVGTGHLAMTVAAQTMVGLLAPPGRLEAYFGWYTTAISAGQLAGPLLAGSLIDLAGHRWAFGVTALIAVIPAALSWHLERHLEQQPRTRQDRKEPSSAASEEPVSRWDILRNPEFQVAVFGSGSVLVAMGVRRAFLPVYLEELAFSASFIGLVLSVRSLFSMFVRIGMESMVRAMGGRGMALVVTSLVTAVSIAAIGLVRSPSLFLLTAVLTGIGAGITQPLTMVIASDAVPRSQRGLAMGMRLTGNRFAQFISPLIFGFVAQWGGYDTAFIVAGGLLASVAFVTNRLRHRLDEDKAAEAAEDSAA